MPECALASRFLCACISYKHTRPKVHTRSVFSRCTCIPFNQVWKKVYTQLDEASLTEDEHSGLSERDWRCVRRPSKQWPGAWNPFDLKCNRIASKQVWPKLSKHLVSACMTEGQHFGLCDWTGTRVRFKLLWPKVWAHTRSESKYGMRDKRTHMLEFYRCGAKFAKLQEVTLPPPKKWELEVMKWQVAHFQISLRSFFLFPPPNKG